MKLFFIVIWLIASFSLTTTAKIVYTDVEPDSLLVTVGGLPTDFNIDLNHDGNDEFMIRSHFFTQFFSGYHNSEVLSLVIPDIDDEPLVLNHGDKINDAKSTWYNSSGQSMNMDSLWPGQLDKYIGLRIKIGSDWHYGWLRISIPQDGQSCMVKDFAYEDSPNTEISAGDAGASSVLWSNFEESSISLYPNPATNQMSVAGLTPGGTLRIINLNGNIVIEKVIDSELMVLNLNGLPSGKYFLIVGKDKRGFVKVE